MRSRTQKRMYRAGELEEAIDRCVAHCLATGEPPVGYVLHKFTDVPEESLGEFLEHGEAVLRGERHSGSEIMGRYRAAKRWEEFKTFYWLERGQKEPKVANFAKFNLKQSGNGGYVEKEPSGKGGKSEITVRLEGIGGAEAAR